LKEEKRAKETGEKVKENRIKNHMMDHAPFNIGFPLEGKQFIFL
jgi:hypothetical protein